MAIISLGINTKYPYLADIFNIYILTIIIDHLVTPISKLQLFNKQKTTTTTTKQKEKREKKKKEKYVWTPCAPSYIQACLFKIQRYSVIFNDRKCPSVGYCSR